MQYFGRIPALCLSWLLALSVPTLAAPAGSESDRLEQMELALFAKSAKTLSSEDRLKALEKSVFGKPQSGTTAGRLDALNKILGTERSTALMPPVAPQRDNSAELPSLAPQSARMQGHVSVTSDAGNKVNDLMRLGIQNYSDGNLPEAERLFQQALSIDRNNASAYFNLGIVAERRGDLRNALLNYRNALTINPNDCAVQQAVISVQQEISNRHTGQVQLQAEHDRTAAVQQQPLERSARAVETRPKGRGGALISVGTGLLGGLLRGGGGLDIGCPLCRMLMGRF